MAQASATFVALAALSACASSEGLLADTRIFDPTTSAWSEGPRLPGHVGGHSSTLLPDGAVLLLGGASLDLEHGVLRCDPIGECAEVGDLVATRELHDSVALADGQVLLVGGGTPPFGVGGPPELFDITSKSSMTSVEGGLDNARAVTLDDGRILAVGTGTTAIFDPTTQRWSVVASPGLPRSGFALTRLRDGRALAIGGDGQGDIGRTVEAFNPTTSLWSSIAPLSGSRIAPTATTLLDGRVLVVGGYGAKGAEVYDPAEDAWTALAEVDAGRWGHAATLLDDGRVLVTGGLRYPDEGEVSTFGFFDPTTNSWTFDSAGLPWRQFHGATRLLDGRVLVTGGDRGYMASRYE